TLPILFAPAASAHEAKDMLDDQDFSATPPVPSAQLKGWILWVNSKQGGYYERSGGQPFAAPVPPGLPPSVIEIIVDNDSGVYTTSSGGVTCVVSWFDNFLLLRFDDGTQFVWMEEGVKKVCSDGSKEHYVKTIGSAGVEDPATGAWSGWIRSSTVDMVQLQKQQKARFRAPAGGTLDLRATSTGAGPWIGADVDELEIVVGPGGVLDLRDNPVANGPVFAPSGPITLRCDTVLLDPGVVIADLCTPPPIVLPAAEVRELELHVPPEVYIESGGSHGARVRVLNTGNTSELVQLTWFDALGWSQPQPTQVQVPSLAISQPVTIPLAVSVSWPTGTAQDMVVQWLAAGGLSGQAATTLRSVPPYTVPVVYCTGKVNSLGCTPKISTSGNPTLSGYDDFHVLAGDVLNNQIGILIWGTGPNAAPFQGGTLCVSGQVTRTPGQVSGGNSGFGTDCSGLYALNVSAAYLAEQGFGAGSSMWAQYWMRDTPAPFGSGLSDAVEATFTP
ncbi:MAG TPA: hypothetical protein VMT18_02565, partial [Planctomycetota bacterium]|nr:hypothetical protein [Planctomycetota bacterium]